MEFLVCTSTDIPESCDHRKSICTPVGIELFPDRSDNGFSPAKKEEGCRVVDNDIISGVTK